MLRAKMKTCVRIHVNSALSHPLELGTKRQSVQAPWVVCVLYRNRIDTKPAFKQFWSKLKETGGVKISLKEREMTFFLEVKI